jgi:hypothetical protein
MMRHPWRLVQRLLALYGAFQLGVEGAQAQHAPPVTHLFTGWYGVDAGVAVFKVDRTKVDPEPLRILEQVKDYYKIKLVDGDSPPERVNVPTGVRVRAEVATKSEPWLSAEKPWELGGVTVAAVVQDGGRYRAWYGSSTAGRHDKVVVAPNGRLKLGSEGGSSFLCYQESDDGWHWRKPALGLVEFQGSTENNIVTADAFLTGGQIFLDPVAPAEERYKLVVNTDIREFDPQAKGHSVLGGAVSPDGLHWTKLPEPLWREDFNNDGSPTVYHDAQTGKYVMFMRANYPRRRSISRSETSDFRRWPVPTMILTPGPDEDPSDDFYDNPYLWYPGSANGHLMLVSTYHRDTSLVDLRLASSMDGAGWNWLSPRTVVKLGQPGAWDGGMLYAVPDMVRLPDGRAAVAILGDGSGHEEYWRTKFERGRSARQGSAWAIWEDGRIAGIEAEKAGEFTTLPLRATGRPIEVNARTGFAGSVRVDVMVEGEAGPPVLRSRALTGDLRWLPLTWEQGDVAAPPGQSIRLRFHLYNAKVFGVRGEGLELVSPYVRK